VTAGDRWDVAVVGAGVIGLASAWRLAATGASVVVIDAAPGSGASGVAAGMLAPVFEARLGEEALWRLNRASLDRWPAFAAELEAASGHRVGYRDDGTLMVALDAGDRAVLDDLADRHATMGLAVDRLRGREARALEPGLAPGVRAGLLATDERSVDPAAVVDALLVAAREAGVTVVRRRVERLTMSPDGARATGVVLEAGAEETTDDPGVAGAPGGSRPGRAAADRIEAGTVVLAAGCHSATLDGVPERARPPVRPVKGQVVTLAQPPDDPLLTRTVRGIVRGANVYLVPRVDGRVVIGATVEERGWDTRPTAGGAHELLRDALALVPGLDDADLVGVRAGLRPGTPDDLPVIGASGVEGLVHATGHHRNGVLLTPITAEAVAASVSGVAGPGEVFACDPDRFAAHAPGVRVGATAEVPR
jgi:glycine oxidase